VTDNDPSAPTAPASPAPTRRGGAAGGRRKPRTIAIWVILAVLGLVAIGGLTAFSESSAFCPTCHEMRPYYDAWQQGKHVGRAECVDCHIDPGVIAHLAHKPSELVELYDHFFADVRYPNYNVALPDSRCVRCHATVQPKVSTLFSHALHQTKAHCKECHAITGHLVPLETLRAAGVLKENATSAPIPGGLTPSSAAGHVKVVCQQCHDQAKMKCGACHSAPHEDRGDCTNCHRPGTAFVFVHPVTSADCGSCHQKPAGHPQSSGPCAVCHQKPGTGWAFSHPSTSTDCASCHQAPANHFGADCAACHSPSVPFAQATFNHPGNTGAHSWRSFPCVRCHPSGYTTASCTCHGGNPPQGD
jgi:hypothetical protein